MSICAQCGQYLQEDDAFCPICGMEQPKSTSEQPGVMAQEDHSAAPTFSQEDGEQHIPAETQGQSDIPEEAAQAPETSAYDPPISDAAAYQSEPAPTVPPAQADWTAPSHDTVHSEAAQGPEANEPAAVFSEQEVPPQPESEPVYFEPAAHEIPNQAAAPPPTTPPQDMSRFCSQCGTKQMPDARFCPICGAKQKPVYEDMIPISQPYYKSQDDFYNEPVAEDPQKNNSKRVAIAVLISVLVIAVLGIVAVVKVLPTMGLFGGKDLGETPIVYVQDNTVLKYKTSDMEKSETITSSFEISTEYMWEASFLSQTSGSGQYILYLNDYRSADYYSEGRGDLYIRDISTGTKDGPSDKGIKISSDVSNNFFFSDDDKYVFYIDYQGNLNVWDYTESRKMDSDVEGFYDWNEDKVLYYKGDPVDEYTSYFVNRDIYLAPFAQSSKEERVKIDTNISDLLDWTEDFSKFIFTKSAASAKEEGNLFDLYTYTVKSDTREKLLTSIGEVVDCDVETDTAIYLMPKTISMTISDVIDDDMAKNDALITPPDMTKYPELKKILDAIKQEYGYDFGDYGSGYSDYDYGYGDYGYDSDYGYGYGDYGSDYGSTSYMDELLQYFIEYYGSLYTDNTAALEREMAAYKLDTKDYSAKLMRDRLREKIAYQTDTFGAYGDVAFCDLHLLKDGERTKLDSNITMDTYAAGLSVNVDLENGFASYVKRDYKGIKKMKMSEITETGYGFTFELATYLQEQLQGEMYVTFLDGSPQLLAKESEGSLIDPADLMLGKDGVGFYFLEDINTDEYNYNYKLYYATITDKSVSQAKVVDEDVAYMLRYNRYDGDPIYLKNRKGDTCDLYTINGDQKERLCYDISYSADQGTLDDEKTLYFFENYNQDRESGDLYLMNPDKTKVGEDVYEFYLREENLIYILREYRNGKGDLYVFDGEKLSLVDYDVTHVLEY